MNEGMSRLWKQGAKLAGSARDEELGLRKAGRCYCFNVTGARPCRCADRGERGIASTGHNNRCS
jgi:hypothetical protein